MINHNQDESSIGHRTRSKVQINEGMDEILDLLNYPQEQVSKSRTWRDLLITVKTTNSFFLSKSCLDLSLESEIDPCSVEEVNQEDYNIGPFSKKELLKINEHRNSRVERKDQIQHSEQSQIFENEQSYLLKVQMTMFVQLVVQLFMVSTNTPDCDTDIMASECRHILVS
ncbi:uncharacterized protein LOC115226949 [Octopus sinensis]|uniref:Uncharacterized protein LOC115226949 n=1 Tax=Octopus sinensis TaxID=2607531 RepID=A0A6P7TWU5_9MOLL|nr:uncharacterized protein LOC115226949 [Octopus sinensis]